MVVYVYQCQRDQKFLSKLYYNQNLIVIKNEKT